MSSSNLKLRKPFLAFATVCLSMVGTDVSAQGVEKIRRYHMHPYPVCFYETDAGAVAASKKVWPGLQTSLRDLVLEKSRRHTSLLIVNSRTAFVKTTLKHHRELLNLWPEIACTGRTSGNETSQTARICRDYVHKFIRSEIEHVELPNGTLVPICQTFLDTEQ